MDNFCFEITRVDNGFIVKDGKRLLVYSKADDLAKGFSDYFSKLELATTVVVNTTKINDGNEVKN